MKTGIFGGSFNPIHKGHIHLAESVLKELGLDRLIFVPSKKSPHRSSSEYASETDRFEMLRLATEYNKSFEVSDYEFSQERTSYTVYTIRHFKELYPDDEFYLLIGSDMLLTFDEWYCFEEIMKNASIVCVSRNEGDYPQLASKAQQLLEYGNVKICTTAPYPVSSTEIREKIRKNLNWYCYLDKNVVQYIRLGKLYL
jgi:nicotinate-nucleotide adenylyltransferase